MKYWSTNQSQIQFPSYAHGRKEARELKYDAQYSSLMLECSEVNSVDSFSPESGFSLQLKEMGVGHPRIHHNHAVREWAWSLGLNSPLYFNLGRNESPVVSTRYLLIVHSLNKKSSNHHQAYSQPIFRPTTGHHWNFFFHNYGRLIP